MNLTIHQTHHTIADFDAIFEYLTTYFKDKDKCEGLHVFPELFLTGYPLQDLCLNKNFIEKYQNLLRRIDQWSTEELSSKSDMYLLMGGLSYELDENGNTLNIKNVIYELRPGQKMENHYSKVLLPNYDIFDEKKYFIPGDSSRIIDFQGKRIGLLVCEDMWPSSAHHTNPVEALKQADHNIDLVVNLSASPFDLKKDKKRIQRGKEISKFIGSPFVYVNRVGVEDEIVFDGGSFMVSGDELVSQCQFFSEDTVTIQTPDKRGDATAEDTESIPSTWEGLFDPALTIEAGKVPELDHLSDDDCELLIKSLGMGVQEYARKSNFNKFLVALSGGMDSALVLTLIKLSLKEGQSLEAVYMPSKFSRDISHSLSVDLCKNLEIPFHVLPISPIHEMCRNEFKSNIGDELEGLADENIQSRLRGTLIYARSNQTNSLVINTSNKSELAVGYSTIYGDSVGAISMLGDVYKSEVFALAKYINRKYDNLIPEEIITRPPSAELREDQQDTDSLPPYERLDAILEGLLSYRLTWQDLVKAGFTEEEVSLVFNLYRKTEYKRSQFCPIIKVKAKSFGFGYRVPLCKDSRFYMQ
jgi:NAD+ synthase (glutamine-hydrolysing)